MTKLIVNGGSSSIKIAVCDPEQTKIFLSYSFSENYFYCQKKQTRQKYKLKTKGHKALTELLDFIYQEFPQLHSIGHRIVYGGDFKSNPTLITPSLLKKLKQLIPLAPLHQPLECRAIEETRKRWPKAPQYAFYDTAFFHHLKPSIRLYPLSSYFEKKGIKRYGFHGINHEYCTSKIHEALPHCPSLKIIVCHLGSGCSLSAILGKQCIDTTMGFTPLDGIMMGTRAGALDPGISIYLLKNKLISLNQLEDYYLKGSGLKGISKLSSDYRVLEKKRQTHPRAMLAIEMFQEHLTKGILAMMASLRGCDVLVFTGGMGEHLASLRRDIIKRLDFLGFKLHLKKNREKNPFWISDEKSCAKIAVLKAQEELFIAQSIEKLMKKA